MSLVGTTEEHVLERMGGSGEVSAPENFAFAKLQGVVFQGEDLAAEHHFEFYMTADRVVMGRSPPEALTPLDVISDEVDLGVGDSSKLSRRHAEIAFNRGSKAFELRCSGRNGLTLTQSGKTTIMKPEMAPQKLDSRALIQLGDALVTFFLPQARICLRPPRDWIKADYKIMHSLLLRFGYGRWDVLKATSPRLRNKPDAELIYVARDLIAKCCIYAKAGVEKKTLREVLKEDLPPSLTPDQVAQLVEKDLKEAEIATDRSEKRKYLRWARKLRLLRNLRDAVNHSALEKLRSGQLTIHTPVPTPWWTAEDDYSLLVGIYKHGYGCVDQVRDDPELSFHGRVNGVAPAAGAANRPRSSDVNDTPAESDEEEDDDEDDEDDDQRADVKDKAEPAHDTTVSSEYAVPKKEEEVSSTVTAKTETKPLEDEDSRESAPTSRTPSSSQPTSEPAASKTDSQDSPFFPTQELLMRRLKAVTHACMREVERDLREESKVRELEEKHRQREEARQDAAAAKQERDAARVREREERRLLRMQPFSKRDAAEFVRALVELGIAYKSENEVNWEWFLSRVEGLRHKYPETLEEAYKTMVQECHHLLEMRDGEAQSDEDEEKKKPAEATIFVHTLERAEKVLERLEFFKYLRRVVINYPALTQTIRGVKRPKELPDWWRVPQDRALLEGVDKYGLSNWDGVASDPELGFEAAMASYAEKHEIANMDDPRVQFPKTQACLRRVKKIIDHFRTRAGTANVVLAAPAEESKVIKPPTLSRVRKEPSSGAGGNEGTAGGDLGDGGGSVGGSNSAGGEFVPAPPKKRKPSAAAEPRPSLSFYATDDLNILNFGDVHEVVDSDTPPPGFQSSRRYAGQLYSFEVLRTPREGPDASKDRLVFLARRLGDHPAEAYGTTPTEAWRLVRSGEPQSPLDVIDDGETAMGLRNRRVIDEIRQLQQQDGAQTNGPSGPGDMDSG